MGFGVKRVVFVTAACLMWLTACETTSTKLPAIFGSSDKATEAAPDATGSVAAAPVVREGPATGAQPELLPKDYTPSDPNDELGLGKSHFRQGDYGLAEQHFRRAVEAAPRDAEAWLGLAASYDRLKRFDLADRAYAQLVKLLGRTPTVMNNIGYSYMLRGDYGRAREILLAAQAKDPGNAYIQNNLATLEESVRTRKAVQ